MQLKTFKQFEWFFSRHTEEIRDDRRSPYSEEFKNSRLKEQHKDFFETYIMEADIAIIDNPYLRLGIKLPVKLENEFPGWVDMVIGSRGEQPIYNFIRIFRDKSKDFIWAWGETGLYGDKLPLLDEKAGQQLKDEVTKFLQDTCNI